jgi:hypothetical protein
MLVMVWLMLALDQVLRKHWSCLTTFVTSMGWSNMERPGGDEIVGSRLFCGLVDLAKGFRVYVTSYGMLAHGFTHV